MSKRRRLPNNNVPPNDASVDIKDDEIEDEARIQEIIKLLDEDSDSDDQPPPVIPINEYSRTSSTHAQRSIYLAIFLLIALFMLWVNYYNAKQLERIKEEYGPEKKVEPELWWQKSFDISGLHSFI